jgi:hypothetical protein
MRYDLRVTIQYADATFYKMDSGKNVLDYGPATLGIDQ